MTSFVTKPQHYRKHIKNVQQKKTKNSKVSASQDNVQSLRADMFGWISVLMGEF